MRLSLKKGRSSPMPKAGNGASAPNTQYPLGDYAPSRGSAVLAGLADFARPSWMPGNHLANLVEGAAQQNYNVQQMQAEATKQRELQEYHDAMVHATQQRADDYGRGVTGRNDYMGDMADIKNRLEHLSETKWGNPNDPGSQSGHMAAQSRNLSYSPIVRSMEQIYRDNPTDSNYSNFVSAIIGETGKGWTGHIGDDGRQFSPASIYQKRIIDNTAKKWQMQGDIDKHAWESNPNYVRGKADTPASQNNLRYNQGLSAHSMADFLNQRPGLEEDRLATTRRGQDTTATTARRGQDLAHEDRVAFHSGTGGSAAGKGPLWTGIPTSVANMHLYNGFSPQVPGIEASRLFNEFMAPGIAFQYNDGYVEPQKNTPEYADFLHRRDMMNQRYNAHPGRIPAPPTGKPGGVGPLPDPSGHPLGPQKAASKRVILGAKKRAGKFDVSTFAKGRGY